MLRQDMIPSDDPFPGPGLPGGSFPSGTGLLRATLCDRY